MHSNYIWILLSYPLLSHFEYVREKKIVQYAVFVIEMKTHLLLLFSSLKLLGYSFEMNWIFAQSVSVCILV